MKTAAVVRWLGWLVAGGASAGCGYYSYTNVAPPAAFSAAAGDFASGSVPTVTRPLSLDGYAFPVFGLPWFTDPQRLTSDVPAPWATKFAAGTRLKVESIGTLTTHYVLAPCYGGDGQSHPVALASLMDGPSRGKYLLIDQTPNSWFQVGGRSPAATLPTSQTASPALR